MKGYLTLLLSLALALGSTTRSATAQPPEDIDAAAAEAERANSGETVDEPDDTGEPADTEAVDDTEAAEDTTNNATEASGSIELEAPELEAPELEEVNLEEEEQQESELDSALDDSLDLLAESEPPSSDPTIALPTRPQPIFGLHGYLRARGELYDNFFLGRATASDPAALRRFAPGDLGVVPEGGGCDDGPCDGDRLTFANMRLRVAPTISLSDDVRVHMMVDMFDNLVLGSTPDTEVYVPGADQFTRARTPGTPIDSLASTQNPPQALRNTTRDSIYMRRAWASVRNRDLGELRFGRMGSHWGLGMLQNDGRGIDADFSTDVDRVMLTTKLFGVHLVAAYDFVSQGIVNNLANDLRGIPHDLAASDDVRQFSFAIARREDERDAQERLENGSWVLEGGIYYMYRSQFLSTAGVSNPFDLAPTFVRRDAVAHMPDIWGRFRWGGLRLEAEVAAVIGSIRNVQDESYRDDKHTLLQVGFAFEGEYRLLDDRLSIRLYTGFATGDGDVNGLSSRDDILEQENSNRRISTFQFHPNYRIDLILWRNIMERVAGAWYLRPGVSYDFIRNPFGRVLGASLDMIYSRAAAAGQTYGGDNNLGVELNANVYYRSEDGPGLMDGFYASFQYGILFPLAGLKRATGETGPSVGRAQNLRLILGVQF